MPNRHRDDGGAAEREWPGERPEIELRQSASLLRRRVEDVCEHPSHLRQRPFCSVDRDRRLLSEVVDADVVEAQDVIGMRVRQDDRVDARDAEAQRLCPQVGRGVEQDRAAIVEAEPE